MTDRCLPKNGSAKHGRASERLPINQIVTDKLPIMTYGSVPRISQDQWSLEVFGLVERELEISWDQFLVLPRLQITTDFHCVTQWSSMDNTWEGVLAKELLQTAVPMAYGRYVMVRCYGGYTTSMSVSDLFANHVLFADYHNGKPLRPEHGGPVRLIIPHLYGWKSAKWVKSVEFTERQRPGFWEQRGYHMRGDPWAEERFDQ